MTDLQKGQISIGYMKMNTSPHKYKYLKRYMDNEGDVDIPGYNPVSGQTEGLDARSVGHDSTYLESDHGKSRSKNKSLRKTATNMMKINEGSKSPSRFTK